MSKWKLIHEDRIGDYSEILRIYGDEYGQFYIRLPNSDIGLNVSAVKLWSIARVVKEYAEGEME